MPTERYQHDLRRSGFQHDEAQDYVVATGSAYSVRDFVQSQVFSSNRLWRAPK